MRLGSKIIAAALALLVGCICVIIFIFFVQPLHFFTKPEAIMASFLGDNPPEALQADVLILARRKMEDTVLAKLRDKNSPKRQYMLVYLCSIGSSKSIDTLCEIAANQSEPTYLRNYALESLFLIDVNVALKFAAQSASNDDELGAFARSLLAGNERLPKRRSFGDAFWCRDVE